ERELMASFDRIKGRVLGALLSVVAQSLLRHEDTCLPELPRMADHCTWVEAASEVLGWSLGDYSRTLVRNQAEARRAMLENSTLGSAIVMALPPGILTTTYKNKTPSELMEALDPLKPAKADRYWPASAGALSQQLKRLSPLLEA